MTFLQYRTKLVPKSRIEVALNETTGFFNKKQI